MTDESITKTDVEKQVHPRNLPFMWRVVERVAAAAIPLLVLCVVAGFVFALAVTLFTWSWDIIR